MTADDRRRQDEALDWVRRIADPDFAAWEEHLAWLERDPRNGLTLEQATLLIEDATTGLQPVPAPPVAGAVNDNAPVARDRWYGRWWLTGAAIAVGLLAFVSQHVPRPAARPRTVVATAAGEARTLRLGDGTFISLNGDSAVSFAPDMPREVRLERGEAFFEVAPNRSGRFRILVNDSSIEDLATAFDVIRDGPEVDVAVREGAVVYEPGRSRVRLVQGQALHVEGGVATVRRIASHAAGGWRDGRLIYHDTPLAVIARDVQRCIGVPVAVDAGVLTRRFTGVIVLDVDRSGLAHRMSSVLGVAMVPEGRGWRLIGVAG